MEQSDSSSDSAEEELEVTEFIHKGQKFLRSEDNRIFDLETEQLLGHYDSDKDDIVSSEGETNTEEDTEPQCVEETKEQSKEEQSYEELLPKQNATSLVQHGQAEQVVSVPTEEHIAGTDEPTKPASAKEKNKKTRVCGLCGQPGHNKRTCLKKL